MRAAALTIDRTPAVDNATPAPSDMRDSWAWLVVSAAARVHLALIVGLVAIATVPVIFGWQATVVQTGSMLPHIRPGDVAITMPLRADDPVPLGRVVSFRTTAAANAGGEATTRLHRIVDVNTDGTFVTQGDANLDADSDPLVRSQIVGQARLLVPVVGLPSLWLTSGNTGLFAAWCLASIAAILFVVFDKTLPSRGQHALTARPTSQES